MIRKLLKLIAIMAIPLLTTHCRFTAIDQPLSILPGAEMTVTLSISLDIVPEPNPHKGVVCVLLPNDWTLLSGAYTSTLGNGTLENSSAWADSAEACHPASTLGNGMKWVAMISDSGYTYESPQTIDVTLQLKAGQTEDCFKLGYLVTKATGGLLCSGVQSWAPLSYPHPVAVSTNGVVCDTAVVERAIEWDNLLDRHSGWTGADGIYSIPLSEKETPGNNEDEQTLLLFSDTFIGEVDSNDYRTSWAIVNNTYAYLDGIAPLDENIEYFWDENNGGQPKAIFVPDTPNSLPEHWYWLMDGLALGDSIYVTGLRMKPGSGGPFNFALDGVALISFQLDGDHLIPTHRQVDTPLFYRNDADGSEIALGQAIMPMHAASENPGADGYIYVYGPRSSIGGKELMAARVLPEHFNDFSQYRYWDGSGWSTAIEDCAPITHGISQEFSVSPLPNGKFILVFQINSSVAIRIGDSPVGPFGLMEIIYNTPEVQLSPDIHVYNAKAHPHLSTPEKLLISYNVNTFDFAAHITNADIYRPRFIWLKLGETPQLVQETHGHLPRKVSLSPNYPNPFNPTTTIPFQVPKRAEVVLKIYNSLGEEIRTLIREELPPGGYKVNWNGQDNNGRQVSSGMYVYYIRIGGVTGSHKMILIK